MSAKAPRDWKGRPVPFITAWSAELDPGTMLDNLSVREQQQLVRGRIAGRQTRLVYRDEMPADRDAAGILWIRSVIAPGSGLPDFGAVHPLRQRATMRRGWCQVCAGPGRLWMVPTDRWELHVARHGAGAPLTTWDPPVCVPCAHLAAARCPALGRRGHTMLSAKVWANTAVSGALISPECDVQNPEVAVPLPGAAGTGMPDAGMRHMVLARSLLSTLWAPSVLTDPEASPGLGVNITRTGTRPSDHGVHE